jgi:hypothetical protein
VSHVEDVIRVKRVSAHATAAGKVVVHGHSRVGPRRVPARDTA